MELQTQPFSQSRIMLSLALFKTTKHVHILKMISVAQVGTCIYVFAVQLDTTQTSIYYIVSFVWFLVSVCLRLPTKKRMIRIFTNWIIQGVSIFTFMPHVYLCLLQRKWHCYNQSVGSSKSLLAITLLPLASLPFSALCRYRRNIARHRYVRSGGLPDDKMSAKLCGK